MTKTQGIAYVPAFVPPCTRIPPLTNRKVAMSLGPAAETGAQALWKSEYNERKQTLISVCFSSPLFAAGVIGPPKPSLKLAYVKS